MVSNPVLLYNALIYNSSFVFLKQPTKTRTETAEGSCEIQKTQGHCYIITSDHYHNILLKLVNISDLKSMGLWVHCLGYYLDCSFTHWMRSASKYNISLYLILQLWEVWNENCLNELAKMLGLGKADTLLWRSLY